MIISPIPGVDYNLYEYKYIYREERDVKKSAQYLSDFISAFMFIRVFFLFKTRFNYSKYRSTYSKTICKEHKFYPTNWFILKV